MSAAPLARGLRRRADARAKALPSRVARFSHSPGTAANCRRAQSIRRWRLPDIPANVEAGIHGADRLSLFHAHRRRPGRPLRRGPAGRRPHPPRPPAPRGQRRPPHARAARNRLARTRRLPGNARTARNPAQRRLRSPAASEAVPSVAGTRAARHAPAAAGCACWRLATRSARRRPPGCLLPGSSPPAPSLRPSSWHADLIRAGSGGRRGGRTPQPGPSSRPRRAARARPWARRQAARAARRPRR